MECSLRLIHMIHIHTIQSVLPLQNYRSQYINELQYKPIKMKKIILFMRQCD